MKQNRVLTALATATLATVALVGCSNPSNNEPEEPTVDDAPVEEEEFDLSHIKVGEIALPDGRSVVCVIQGLRDRGGIDCDWDNAAG